MSLPGWNGSGAGSAECRFCTRDANFIPRCRRNGGEGFAFTFDSGKIRQKIKFSPRIMSRIPDFHWRASL